MRKVLQKNVERVDAEACVPIGEINSKTTKKGACDANERTCVRYQEKGRRVPVSN
jgi:hypothetical protein